MSVTEKSTKKQILDAYQASIAEIKKLKADQLDPKEAKARSRAKEVAEATTPEVVTDVLDELSAFTQRVPNYINETVSVIRGHADKMAELREALEIQKNELQELYDISAEADTLAALVDTKRKVKADLDESIDDVKKGWAEEREETQKRHAREAEEAEQAHNRRISEWEYEFKRQVKMKKDELDDSLAARKRDFDSDMAREEKVLAERREELEKREATMTEIETKLTAMEQELVRIKEAREVELQAVKEEAKAKAKTSYAIETNALKKSHEAEVSILAAKVESLELQLRTVHEENSALSIKLDEAYEKIQAVAVKSLESQGNARMVEMSRSMAADQSRPSKN